MSTTTIAGNILGAAVVSVSITPIATAQNATVEQSFTVPGVKVGDFVEAAAPGVTSGIAVTQSRVTAANTVAIAFTNATSGSLTAPVGAYQFLIARPESISATFSM